MNTHTSNRQPARAHTAPACIQAPSAITAVGIACLMLLGMAQSAAAAPLLLSTIPAGNGGREPAPNVIISVDDSGSMAWDVITDSGTITTASKMNVLKAALRNTFGNGTANSGIVPDGRIRLAWQSMWDNGNSMPSNGAKRLTLGATNSMKPFQLTHRTAFENFVDKLTPNNGTPSHRMMMNAFQYMNAPVHLWSPWATTPGVAQDATTYLACRRTYHVFMTDGAWNTQDINANQRTTKGDGVSQTLPDGTVYNPSAATSKVYKDAWGDIANRASTLSDWAFAGWATDLQSGGPSTTKDTAGNLVTPAVTATMVNGAGGVRPLIKRPGTERFATTACTGANNCIDTPEYWNPRNDPATWQHMIQYTIGFGGGATDWPTAAGTPNDWNGPPVNTDTYGGDLPKLVQGEVSWADPRVSDTGTPAIRTSELWHMAINGRGKFYPAKTAADLNAAFTDILNTVIADTSKPLVAIATSSSRLGTDTSAFIAGFDASNNYSGSLVARPLNSVTGNVGAGVTWDAAAKLDAILTANLANRVVLSYSGTAGIPWKTYASLPAAQRTPLNKNSTGTVDSKGQERVDFIRGDRTKELTALNPSGIFRQRGSRLGNIVNSNLLYLGKPASGYSGADYQTFRSTGPGGVGGREPMLYVGANDGMLHGFTAASNNTGGRELLAYIPQGVAQGNLRKLTDIGYTHEYSVDGTPFAGDAYIGNTPVWTTVLVGTLGLGGKGYFALNVSNPANFTDANAASLVLLDTTATTDPDIGYIASQPVYDETYPSKSRQIVKMNNDRWAVVMGNGVNSSNEAPVLLIQYLDGVNMAVPVKISPCTQPIAANACTFKGSNGLSTPQLIDLNGDGKVDVAYAGDLQGNVWKFDLAATASTGWKTSFASGALQRPFFIAKQGGAAQTFTTAPFWMPHPDGGVSIAIGTGRNLTDADQTDTTSIQTLYSLRDASSYAVNAGVVTITDVAPINLAADANPLANLVSQTVSNAPIADAGSNYYTSSRNSVDYSTKKGWYMNWAIGGQRTVQNIRLFEGQNMFVQSMTPKQAASANQETCSLSSVSERNFVSILNIFSGKPAKDQVFILSDTTNNSTYGKDVTMVETNGETTVIDTNNGQEGKMIKQCPPGQECASDSIYKTKYMGKRSNWRQVQR